MAGEERIGNSTFARVPGCVEEGRRRQLQAPGAAWSAALAIPDPFRYFPASRAPGPERARRRSRRGAGVVERDGLENRYTLTGIEGSNPSPSANQSWELFSPGSIALIGELEGGVGLTDVELVEPMMGTHERLDQGAVRTSSQVAVPAIPASR